MRMVVDAEGNLTLPHMDSQLAKNIFINTEIENVSYLQILLLFVIPLILVLICGISYILGTKKFTFGEKIIYKNK